MKDLFDRLTMGRALIIGFSLTSFYYFAMFDNGETQLAAIQSAQSEIARIQGEIQGTEQKIERAQAYQRASENLGSSIQRLLSYIPANFRIGQLMKTVSEEARVAGLDITRLAAKTVQEPKKVEDFVELGVTVELQGQYDQLLSFMSSLTRKRQIFIFEKLDLASATPESSGMIKVNADIHAFSYQGTAQ